MDEVRVEVVMQCVFVCVCVLGGVVMVGAHVCACVGGRVGGGKNSRG